MDRVWGLRFMAIGPGIQATAFFDTEEKAREIFDKYSALASKEMGKETEPLIFQDLIGWHSLRVDYLPYCAMSEIGPNDLIMMEVNKKIEASQRAAGFTKSVGFEAGKEGIK